MHGERRQKTGVQEFRSSGVQEFRSSGVQEFRSSGSSSKRNSAGAAKSSTLISNGCERKCVSRSVTEAREKLGAEALAPPGSFADDQRRIIFGLITRA